MSVPVILLFLGACLGNLGLVVFGLNWLFGVPMGYRTHKRIRHACGLGVIAVPCLFWAIAGLDLAAAVDFSTSEPARTVFALYLAICWFVGLGVLPVITVARWRRRRPAILVSNHTHTLDVAAELGYKPIGHGRHQRLACLPRNEIFQVDFAERTFRLPQIPSAWEGLSILHVSDIHLCGTPDREFFQFVMDRCGAWEPDLVALTGDIVDSKRHHRWLLPVLGRLRWRIAAFAVLGNHDYWYDPSLTRRRLCRLGFSVLENRWETLDVRGEPLTVIGHEGPWFQPAPQLADCPEGVFRLCLSHTPDNLAWARRHKIDLMLAGHNHGGQIRLPWIGSVFVPSRYSRRYDCGTFHEPPTLLHVSRGLAGQHPLRYNCRPEVTRIVLTK